MKNLKKFISTFLVLTMIFALAACGSDTGESVTETGENASEAVEAVELEGRVIVDGSGTVYPLMAHIAEEYMVNEEAGVSVQVGRAGSSAGFKKFIPGETDFSDASRAIKDSEIEQLTEVGMEMGVDVYEFILAYDGLTMVINKDNTWATEMTQEEIVNMYLASGGITTWADIRAEWPAEEISFYGPNENHGTYEFFYETILDEQDMVASASLQQEYSTLVDLVSNDVNAIAFFGFGYYVSNTDQLTAVHIDFGEGPVEPTLETIGTDLPYAGFTRPVFTYLNVNYAKEKPQVLDFAKYVVSLDGASRLAGENGFAPLPDAMYEDYQEQLDALNQ